MNATLTQGSDCDDMRVLKGLEGLELLVLLLRTPFLNIETFIIKI